jgi:serine/threonine protein kinase
MSDVPLDRLEEMLAEALELSPEQRDGYLARACGDDHELRREVEELLALHDEAAEYFDTLSNEIVDAAPLEVESAARPRIRIGPYRTLEAIGHGGMGAVYRAERSDGVFDQKVALKLLHRDMETPQLRARFVAERQILARLSHPNIARLQDGGVTEEGRPYFVMEYVEGAPITHYCHEHDLSLDKVLRLFLDVIGAVSYLHRNLVVHRDLKPSNIFVDRSGQVKLLDFGIAKLLAEAPGEAGVTRTGELLMTPEYAAPEQLLGAPVTTATDVYALGVVLYELLTGSRPHQRSLPARHDADQELPPTPSSRLRSRHKKKGTKSEEPLEGTSSSEPAVAWRRIDADLDTICLMALRPEPEARYPSAEQLGQDIERFLEGQPVRARKSTLGYRVGKFARRHRRSIAAAAVVLALIAAGLVRELGLRRDAEQARTEAQTEAAKSATVEGFLADILTSVEPEKTQGKEVTVAEALDQAAARIATSPEFAEQPSVEASVRRTIGHAYAALGKHAEAREHLERALELGGGLEVGDSDMEEAAAWLGSEYIQLGLYDKAEVLLERILEVRVERYGEEHPDALKALNHVADLKWYQGKYEEVEAIDRRILDIRWRVLGEDHPDTVKSLNAVATSLFSRGELAEAAQLFEQALAFKKQQLGDLHPDTLVILDNLASARVGLGQYAEAESLLEESIASASRVMGADHEQTAVSHHNLGVLLTVLARYDEAEEHLLQARAIRDRLPGNRAYYLHSCSCLADAYRYHGRVEEAERLYLSTLKQQRARFDLHDPLTLKTMGGLAGLRVQQGDLAAAEALIQETMAPLIEIRGEAHQETLELLDLLARIRNQQGCFEEAAEICERGIGPGARELGADNLAVLSLEYERARALAGLQQLDEASKLAVHIYETRMKTFGEEHPSTIEAERLVRGLSQGETGSGGLD